jgi:hypothetical protein
MSLAASTELNIPPSEQPKGALSVPPSQGLSGSPNACRREVAGKPSAEIPPGMLGSIRRQAGLMDKQQDGHAEPKDEA